MVCQTGVFCLGHLMVCKVHQIEALKFWLKCFAKGLFYGIEITTIQPLTRMLQAKTFLLNIVFLRLCQAKLVGGSESKTRFLMAGLFVYTCDSTCHCLVSFMVYAPCRVSLREKFYHRLVYIIEPITQWNRRNIPRASIASWLYFEKQLVS